MGRDTKLNKTEKKIIFNLKEDSASIYQNIKNNKEKLECH